MGMSLNIYQNTNGSCFDKPQMEELEQAYGWKHDPYNMLLDGHALTNYACMLKS